MAAGGVPRYELIGSRFAAPAGLGIRGSAPAVQRSGSNARSRPPSAPSVRRRSFTGAGNSVAATNARAKALLAERPDLVLARARSTIHPPPARADGDGTVLIARDPSARALARDAVLRGGDGARKAAAAAARPTSASPTLHDRQGGGGGGGDGGGDAPRGGHGRPSNPQRTAQAAVGKGGRSEDKSARPPRGASGADVGGRSSAGDTVVIHVCDEARSVNRDFTCGRALLLREMKYFASYLSNSSSRDEVDISVHCDAAIFDWLMRYVKRGDDGAAPEPELDVSSVVSVLISSEFLKMGPLVDRCLRFVAEHAAEVVKLPIDLSCIGDALVARLVVFMDEQALEDMAAADRRDKLTSRAFRAALERLLAGVRAPVQRCAACGQLYTAEQQDALRCRAGRPFVDYRGRLAAHHRPSPTWSLRAFLHHLRANRVAWRTIYWRLWGVVRLARCAECGDAFQLANLLHCDYHPRKPLLDAAAAAAGAHHGAGYYPCCSSRALRFDPHRAAPGCAAKEHRPTCAEGARLAAIARARGDRVLVPFDPLRVAADAACASARQGPQPLDGWDPALGTVRDPADPAPPGAMPALASSAAAAAAHAFFQSPFQDSPYIVFSSNSVVPRSAWRAARRAAIAAAHGELAGAGVDAQSVFSSSSSSSASSSSSSSSVAAATKPAHEDALPTTAEWAARKDATLPSSNVWSRSRNEVVYSERALHSERGRRPRRDIAPGSPRKRRLWRLELLMEEDTHRMQQLVGALAAHRTHSHRPASPTRDAPSPPSSLGKGRLSMHCAAVRAALDDLAAQHADRAANASPAPQRWR